MTGDNPFSKQPVKSAADVRTIIKEMQISRCKPVTEAQGAKALFILSFFDSEKPWAALEL